MFTNRSISRIFSILFVFLFVLTQADPAYAASGDLDPTFGEGGIVTTPVVTLNGNDGGNSVVIQASATQADSKIVMAGYSQLSSGTFFTVVRYNDDGSLDPTFAGDGIVTTGLSGSSPYDRANAVAIQPDGKIVVAGIAFGTDTNYNYRFGLVRYNGDGSLDTSFDTDGIVITNVTPDGSYQEARSVAILPDGKIVVVGFTYQYPGPIIVVRYNSDGSLDTSFDTDGMANTIVGAYSNHAQAVAIDESGRIVVVGSINWGAPTYNEVFAVLRYNDDGSLDTSFDADGSVTTALGTYSQATSVAIQPDGKIVVAGNGQGIQFSVVRYNDDGSLDTSFSTDGIMTTPVRAGRDFARSVAIQADGQIVVVGYCQTIYGDHSQFGVVRVNGSDGSLDTSFAGDGILTTSVNGDDDQANSVAIQSDGKIVVGGTANDPQLNQTDIAVVRYNNDGTLDPAFDGDGIVTTNISRRNYSTAGNSLAVQDDGKVVMVGTLQTDNLWKFRVARFNTEGTLDTSFGLDGIVNTKVSEYSYYRGEARAVAIQDDGKIVVAGTNQYQFVVVRYKTDGSLDTSFGTNGIMSTSLGGYYEQANSVAIQPDGQIVVAGFSYGNDDQYKFGVVRLNQSDGSLDPSFDTDGIATTIIVGAYDIANSVAIQSNGDIVLAGTTSSGPPNYQYQFGVIRYNSDGSLDTTFDEDGIVTTSPSGYYDEAKSVAIQSDGQIVVAGYGYGPPFYNNRSEIIRYNGGDGSLDSSFGQDGIATPSVNGATVQPASLAIQSDGQIVIAGNYGNQVGVMRLNHSDGSLDPYFNNDGIVTTSVSGYSDQVKAMVIQPDGRILVGGMAYFIDSYAASFMVVRYEGGSSTPILTDQTISVTTSAPASAVMGDVFTVDATASSGLPVSYSSSGACTNVDADFTMTSGTGECTVIYDQPGNASYNPAPQVTEIVTAQPTAIDQTITVNTHAPASAVLGDIFTVAAEASSGLTVTYDSAGACTNVDETFTIVTGTGTCTVYYYQAGDANYNPAYEMEVVADANDAPIITESDPQSMTVPENGGNDVFLHATDADLNHSLNWSFVTPPMHGTGYILPQKPAKDPKKCEKGTICPPADQGDTIAIKYFPETGYVGTDTFEVQVSDGTLTDTLTVNVMIENVNDAPVITESDPQEVTISQDGSPSAFDLTLNATDADSDPLTWSISSPASSGTATTTAGEGDSNVIGYSPNAGFSGTDSFGVEVSDGELTADITINVLIRPVLTITADSQAIMYGDPDPAFTFSYNGFSEGDDAGSLDTPPTCTVSTAHADAGSYPIVCSGGSDDIYDFLYVDATLTIAQQPLTVTADPQSKVYASADPALTSQITSGALLFADTINGDLTRAPGEGAGTYAITQGTLSAGLNYDLTFVGADLTVTKADQTISVTINAPSNAVTGAVFTVAATSSSTLPVSYTSSGACTNVGATFTMTDGTGICLVNFDQAGNTNYNPAPQLTQAVGGGDAPSLLTPANAEHLLSLRPSFDWTDVPGATSYTIQISGNVGFTGSPITNTVATSTFTQPSNLPANATRYWRVRANPISGAGPWSAVRSFVTANPPGAPALTSPGNNTLIIDYTPLLDWNDSTVPAGTTFLKYEVQIAADSSFTSPTIVFVSGPATNSSYTPAADLDANATYYWQVRAYNTLGQYSAWSTRHFRTALLPPTLLSPNDSGQLLNNRPTFDWADVPGATGYRLDTSTNSSFSSVTTVNVTASTYTPTADLTPGVILYWRVRSKGTNGPSDWSAVRVLTTANPPTVPTLSSPANNAKVSGPSPLFDWNNSTVTSGAVFDHYQIQIATDGAFTNIVHDHNVSGIGNSQDSSATLASATTYSWRVRSVDTVGGYSAWSAVRTVKIKFAGPTLNTPVSGVTVGSRMPTFTWGAVGGATDYTIQVSKSPAFGSLAINKTATGSTYTTTTNLAAATTYYWRVRVKSPTSYGPGDWSTVFSFTTP